MTPNDGVDTRANRDEYDDDEGHENTWIPPLSLRTREQLRLEIQQASSPDTIMALQGNTHVRARQLQSMLDGEKLGSDIMGAFCRILDNVPKKQYCKIFKPGLYDALNTSKPLVKDFKRMQGRCQETHSRNRHILIRDCICTDLDR